MLVAEGLVKRFRQGRDSVTPLDGVTLELSPGERVGLVGRSGSGKSTLARLMALLVPADEGRVVLDGSPVEGAGLALPPAVRRRVQLMWQSPREAVDPRLCLHDVILEPLVAGGRSGSHTTAVARVAQWVERVGLTQDLVRRHPHEVSDGQLQRACLARALAVAPGYLICDEISSMLDVSTQAALLDVIAEEQRATRMGVLLVTHDRVLVRHWCERTVELVDGKARAATLDGRHSA